MVLVKMKMLKQFAWSCIQIGGSLRHCHNCIKEKMEHDIILHHTHRLCVSGNFEGGIAICESVGGYKFDQ